jgi:condensin-2 complex subunit H2
MERQSRFAYLLEPIRDLTKNWEVDVARQLDDYLSEIAEITISFDGGATQLNFAEAALLIQGSACIYSRKVEYLHALVYQTLDLISSNRKLAHGSSVDDQGRDRDVSFAVCRAEEELVVLDGLPVTANVKNTLDTDLTVATTVPRTPLSLTPLQESDRVNSTPLLSRTGELLGSKVDFKMNTGSVHLSGTLILEPVDQQMVITVTRRGGAEPVTITSTTPAAAITSMLSCGGGASGVDMDTSDAGPAVLDDSGVCEGVDLGASPVLGLPNQSPSQCQNPNPSVRKKQARVVEKKMSDPLQPLDPHAENLNDCKPVKRGVAHRLPAALKTSSEGTRRRNRKRNVGTTPPKTETLAEFIHKSCKSMYDSVHNVHSYTNVLHVHFVCTCTYQIQKSSSCR